MAQSPPIILLLRGRSGSGKDTVANILQEKYGYVRYAFADILKEMVAERYGGNIATLHTQEGKQEICPVNGKTWRQVLIDEGAKERQKDSCIFAKRVIEKIARKSTVSDIVISDWRYPNELSCIKDSSLVDQYSIQTLHIISPSRIPVFDDDSEHMLDSRIDDPILINPDTIEKLALELQAFKRGRY